MMPMPPFHKPLALAVAIVLAIPACFLLYFGIGMLLLVPAYPGEAWLTVVRLRYSLPRLGGGLILFVLIAWLWGRQSDENAWDAVERTAKLFGLLCVLFAIGFGLFMVVLIVIAAFRQH